MSYIPLFGRFAIALIFVVNGLHKALEFDDSVAFLQLTGMPLANLLLVGSIAVEVMGGMMIVIGYKIKWTAMIMAVYLIITTIIFHPVWVDMVNFTDFLKNLSIIGGLLILSYYGSGPKSIDRVLE